MKAVATYAWVAAIEERMRRRDYHAALELVRHETSARAGVWSSLDQLRADILTAECLAFLGQYREAISISRRAARVLRRGDNHLLYGRACFSTAVARYYLGDLEAASEHVNLALFSFKRAGEPECEARALNWSGNIQFDKSEYRQAIASYQACVAVAQRHRLPRWVAVANGNIARTYLLMGQLRDAARAFRGVREFHVENGEVLSVIRHDLSVAYADILARRFESAEIAMARLQQEGGIHRYPRDEGIWFEYMGELELGRGRWDDAVGYLERAIALGIEVSSESVIGQSRRLLAEVRLGQANLDQALAEGERALVSIRKVGERFEEGAVHRVFGVVYSHRGATEETAKAFRHSIDILRTIGARLEWGKSCLAAGRCALLSHRERLACLMEAERLFAEVGVPYWIEQTEAELTRVSEESVPHRPPVAVRSRGNRPMFIAEDPSTVETLRLAERYARDDIAILITGETGTGKDLLARYIHFVSSRRGGPFVSIDLNTIPESLWESELFGHGKGTFTGASAEKIGLLETADRGTVFLNEIGNLSPALQGKLLELLDDRQIRRLGETKSRALDARFIAATNRDLREAVDSGGFRADLFFRLEQAPLHLAPLRDRRADVIPLIRHFLAEFQVSPHAVVDLPKQAWVQRVLQEPWYGNIRQLRNFLWRVAILVGPSTNGEFAQMAERLIGHLPAPRAVGQSPGESQPVRLRTVLERNHWNQRAAARELGISEAGVRRRMRRWEVPRPAL